MPEYLTSRKSVAGGSPNHPMSIWLEVDTMSTCNSLWRCEDIWPMQPNGFRIQGIYLHPHNLHSVILQTDFKGLQVEMGEIMEKSSIRKKVDIGWYQDMCCSPVRRAGVGIGIQQMATAFQMPRFFGELLSESNRCFMAFPSGRLKS